MSRLNLHVTGTDTWMALQEQSRLSPESVRILGAIQELEGKSPLIEVSTLSRAIRHSESQLQQDVAALLAAGCKRNGFFVEFGAGHPIELSNTFMLEQQFGWSGILADPSPKFAQGLRQVRAATFDPRCVWVRSGEFVDFTDVDVAEMSGMTMHIDPAVLAGQNGGHRVRRVETVALNELLLEHEAPSHIDYLSVDTEGSELQILGSLDFRRWSFSFLSVEHNYSPARDQVQRLLASHGYRRVLGGLTEWDDWFVRA